MLLLEPYENIGGARFTAFVEQQEAVFKGKIDFVDPVTLLEEKTGIPVLKVANEVDMTPGEDGEPPALTIYPIGYSVLAKLQFTSILSAKGTRKLTAFTYITNPEIAQYMRVSLYTRCYANGSSKSNKEEANAVYSKQCFSGAFLPFFSVDLPKGETDFIFLLECNLPEATRDCEYFINMFEQEVGPPGKNLQIMLNGYVHCIE